MGLHNRKENEMYDVAKTLKTVDDVRNELLESIKSFDGDPPDNEYQLGFLAALLEQWKVLGGSPAMVERAQKIFGNRP